MQEFENQVPVQQPAEQDPWFPQETQVTNAPFAEPAQAPVEAQPPIVESPVFAQPVFEAMPQQEVPQQPVAQPAAPPKAPRKKKGKLVGRILAAVLVVALIIGSSGATMYYMTQKLKESDALHQQQLAALEQRLAENDKKGVVINTVSTPSNQENTNSEHMTPAQVYAANLNSVVLIKNVVSNGLYTSGGTGSGFILTEDGYVVTNHHVIEGGGTLSVVTVDGKEHRAELIGSDNANDVALLKIDAEGLQAVTIGDSDVLTVGDQVAAIGNPLGELTSTLTVGYVSAKERDVNTSGFAINMLQTDAAINSGNSGGPLFNMYGQVVGITTAKYSGSSSSGASIEGIGFAIPINDVIGMLEDLMTYGYVVTPYMGVSVSDMDSQGATYYGLPMGAYVNSVEKNTAAEKAGLQAKDIIVKVGDYKVDSVNSLGQALRHYEVGQTIQIVVYRSGAEKTLSITLAEKPQEDSADTQPEAQQGQQLPGGFQFPGGN